MLAGAEGAETQDVNAGRYLDAMQSLAEGRYEQAREIMQQLIADEPNNAGAWLDLAILQCSLGRTREANLLFDAIETRFSPPPAILAVIDLQRAQGCVETPTKQIGRFRLLRGYDTNVNQGASNPNFSLGSGAGLTQLAISPEYLPKKDAYYALSGEYARDLSSSGTFGFVQILARKYDDLSRYDLNSLIAGVEHPWRYADWELRGTASLGFITLGGKLYQRLSRLEFLLVPPLTLPDNWSFGIVGGLSHIGYPTLTGFNSLLPEVRGQLTYKTSDILVQAAAGYVYDQGSSERPGGDRNGTLFSLTGRARIAGNVFGEASWTDQYWRGERPYSPGLIDQNRRQHSQVLRTAVVFPISAEHAVHVEFREIQNRENISLFQYQERIFQIGWQWQPGF